jgi:signal transduction histidine kinase
MILLRPVNRARLEIAIEQSMTRPRYTVDCDLMRINRDELLECLLHANLRLQEFDQDRSHFLARAIHELRAPLTSLNGYCRLLLDRKLGALSTDQMNALSRMRRSVERLGRIVSTMFDLSVGRTAEDQADYQPGNIVECLEQAVYELEPTLRDRNLQLDVRLLPPAGEISFDIQHMEQVFLNLLDNSCKFTGRGGVIRLSAYPYFWERRVNHRFHSGERRRSGKVNPVPNSYRIDIADNGPGIPPDRLERTFAESSVYGGGDDRSGAGLALAIARMFVRKHKGHIWAESDGPTGITFSVVLPHLVESAPAIVGTADTARG